MTCVSSGTISFEGATRDQTQTTCLEDRGYTVIRFGRHDDWGAVIAQHPSLFGKRA